MDIVITGVGFGLFSIAVGITLMGYFIGKGLKNDRHPKKNNEFNLFIKEKDLGFYIHDLNKDEIKDLLKKYPDIPKVELNGSYVYPYKQLMDWLSSIQIQNNDDNTKP